MKKTPLSLGITLLLALGLAPLGAYAQADGSNPPASSASPAASSKVLRVPAASNRESQPHAAPAQLGSGTDERPKGEIYGGVAYSNLSILGFESRRHSVGWGFSVTGHITRHFGITGDFGGQYDPECPKDDIECFVELLMANQIEDYSSHQFLVGPRLTIPGERFQGFVHALFGGVYTSAAITTIATGERTKVTSGPNFAMAYGGGLEWNVRPRFAVRLFQVDYIPVREDTVWRHNMRIQGGVVFRF